MPTILELFNQREVLTYLEQQQPAPYFGESLFPEVKRNSLEFDVLVGADRTPVSAVVHAFDTESVIRSRQAEMQDLKLFLIKHKNQLTEREIIALENPRDNEEKVFLMTQVYNDLDRLVRGVRARVERFRMEALANGKITVVENNLNLTVDYHVPPEHQEALTTTAWDQPDADPIADIQRWSEELDGMPTRALTSTKVFGKILRNKNVIAAVVGVSGRIPTRREVNDYLIAQGLPTIVTYDDKYRDEQADGSYVKKRYFPEDKFVMFGDGALGETIYGPTAEELRLRRDPSIETYLYGPVLGMVYETNVDPVSTWKKAVATAIPSFPAANEVFQAKVLNP